MLFSPYRYNMLTQVECEYYSHLLLKQMQEQISSPVASNTRLHQAVDLELFHQRAKITCSMLAINMIMPDVTNKIYFDFHEDITVENVLKILIRARKLFDIRTEVTRIFQLLVEIEQVLRPGSLVYCMMQ